MQSTIKAKWFVRFKVSHGAFFSNFIRLNRVHFPISPDSRGLDLFLQLLCFVSFCDVSMKYILFYSRGSATICSIFETSKRSHFGKTCGGREQSEKKNELKWVQSICGAPCSVASYYTYFTCVTRFWAAIERKVKHIETFDPLFGSFILKVFVHFEWNSSIRHQKLKTKMKMRNTRQSKGRKVGRCYRIHLYSWPANGKRKEQSLCCCWWKKTPNVIESFDIVYYMRCVR